MVDVIPLLLIVLARMLDVSIGTLRVIFISQGRRFIAPLLGFIEVIIWLVAINYVMSHLTSVYSYVAYGAGFALGTFMGMWIEEALVDGRVLIKVFTKPSDEDLVNELRRDFKLTLVNGQGREGQMHILFSVVDKRKIEKFVNIIKHHNDSLFYTIESVRYSSDLVPHQHRSLFHFRKSK